MMSLPAPQVLTNSQTEAATHDYGFSSGELLKSPD